MSPVPRLLSLAGFVAALCLFRLVPDWARFDGDTAMWWGAGAQLGGPLVAAICCAFAARRAPDSQRSGWVGFAIGSSLYFAGNLSYLLLTLYGALPAFPSLPEAAFFLMALFFAAGMLRLSQMRRRFGAVQLYNFVLIYFAVALTSLFVLHGSIAVSVMPTFPTLVAFLYPVLWFSVAAFGVVSLAIYPESRRSFAFILMVLALVAEAMADFRYALALMEGNYQIGGPTQLLWVASSILIVWAAAEQIARGPAAGNAVPLASRRTDNGVAQATVPAFAVGAIIIAAGFAGAGGNGPYTWFAGLLAIAFALVAGFREHWIINVQRQLRQDVEASREELSASQRKLSGVLESTSDSVLVVDRDWNVVYFNRHAAETINRSDLLRIGISLWDLFPAAQSSGEGDHYRKAIAAGRPEEFELFVEDRQIWLGIQAYPTDDGISIFFRDISDSKLARDRMEHLAQHDSLTGLANRALFQERLKQAAERPDGVTALLLDLDHFKEVNDGLGHDVGDALLVSTAQRMRELLGADATVARLGGDEFAAILVGTEGDDEAGMLAQRLVDAMMLPHAIEGQSVRVGVSIGLVSVAGGTTLPEEILKKADIALYAAKSEARGSFRFFEPEMQVRLRERQLLRADLLGALERGEFSLAYQPLVDLKQHRVAGFEALLRWTHPERGLVPPDVFIPIAEETGLIVEIGQWVLRNACAEAMRWPDHIGLAVNLSPRQFAEGDLVEHIQATLRESGLATSRLELEITETVLLRDSNPNLLVLTQLQALGVRIALDDFGTGFSSLGYLQRFPFSRIKIDRSFVSGLPESEESQAIVRAVIGLGRSLGLQVTAEGVETQAQLDWVSTGCDEAQGYFLSRPVDASQIAQVIAQIDGQAPGTRPAMTVRRAG